MDVHVSIPGRSFSEHMDCSFLAYAYLGFLLLLSNTLGTKFLFPSPVKFLINCLNRVNSLIEPISLLGSTSL